MKRIHDIKDKNTNDEYNDKIITKDKRMKMKEIIQR